MRLFLSGTGLAFVVFVQSYSAAAGTTFLIQRDAERKFTEIVNGGTQVVTEVPLLPDDALVRFAQDTFQQKKASFRNVTYPKIGIVAESVVARGTDYTCGRIRTLWLGKGLYAGLGNDSFMTETGYAIERSLLRPFFTFDLGVALARPQYTCVKSDRM